MGNSRDQVIDFFKGIAICDMVLVHFSGYFPPIVEKLVSYTDIAMEGFVFLAGFMVGRRYYGKYIRDNRGVIQRLLGRLLQIIFIQYVLILTINVPLYFVSYERIRGTETLSIFLLKSMAFLNQLGLIHILPTFIPLFLISPLILYLFCRKLDVLVLCGSVCLFAVGNVYPYILDVGEKTIFPFILWQIYFVAGCFLGKRAYLEGKIIPENTTKYFLASIFVFSLTMCMKHGKVISPSYTSKFPLNAPGLFYGSSILFLIYAFTLKYWDVLLGRIRLFNYYLPLFGRHSLLVFVLHVYTAKILGVLNHLYRLSLFLNYLLILISVVGIYEMIFLYDVIEKRNIRIFQPIDFLLKKRSCSGKG